MDFYLRPERQSVEDDDSGVATGSDTDTIQFRLPPLKLYDPRGHTLDIDTELQKKIRLAEACTALGLADSAAGLKLPKYVTATARPDYSRAPPVSLRPSPTKLLGSKADAMRKVSEIRSS